MASADKLGLGLDEIIRSDPSSNRRGGRGGKRGFRGRAGGRVGGQTDGFRTRGGGGLVTILLLLIPISVFTPFSLEHQIRPWVVGSTTCMMITPIKFVADNELVV